MSLPVAAHTFDFVRVYISTRTSGSPGSGVWTNPTLIFDGSATPTQAESQTFSAGALTDSSGGEPKGMIVNLLNNNTGSIDLAYLGNGLPGTPSVITFSGQVPPTTSSDFWDVSQGAWTQGSWQFIAILVPKGGGSGIEIIGSNVGGVTWSMEDSAHAPPGTNANNAAIQRV